MTVEFPAVILWLFVINLGIAAGAGLYESRIVIADWARSPFDFRWPDSGRRFWIFATTIPLTLLTVANLIVAWQAPPGDARLWWLGAAVGTLIERIATFGYFIPAGIRLQRAGSKPGWSLRFLVGRWRRYNRVRSALTVAAWLAALHAYSVIV